MGTKDSHIEAVASITDMFGNKSVPRSRCRLEPHMNLSKKLPN